MFDIDDISPYASINDFSFYEPLPDTPSDSSSESSDIDDDPYQTSSSTPSITGGASTRINNWMAKLDLHHPFLKTYQYAIQQYFLSPFCKNKDILLFWLTVGSGKTLLSLSCAIAGLEADMFQRVVILSPKSIQDEFKQNLQLYCELSTANKSVIGKRIASRKYEAYLQSFHFIAYNSWKANEDLKRLGPLEHTLFIIDEAHLFGKAVMKTNLTEEEEQQVVKFKHKGNALKMYNTIRNLKYKKIICLTGTPASKFPYETIPLFNMGSSTKKPLFTETLDQFNDKYSY